MTARLPCPRCDGCGYTAADEDHTPWSKVGVEARGELSRTHCNWCAGSGRLEREPKDGDLRIWVVHNPPARPVVKPVPDIAEAKRLLTIWMEADSQNMAVAVNAFGCEEFDADDDEWSEWHDGDGRDICEILDGGNDNP